MKTEKAPPCIRVHRDDNVAIVVDPDGLRAGTQLPDGLTLRDSIPQAHKIALSVVALAWGLVNFGLLLWMPAHLVEQGASMAMSVASANDAL